MYKCIDCGHIFEEGEQSIYRENHGFPGGAYEEFESCPVCGGDIEKTVRCVDCDGEFLSDELICGRCPDCVEEAITFDSFLDFATTGTDDGSEVDVLEDFVLRELYKVNGHDVVLTCSSIAFKDVCRKAYEKAVEDDQCVYFPGNRGLLGIIRSYIKEANLLYEFAEYLEVKERGEKK